MTFRERCRPIIARVLAQPFRTQAELSAALQRAFPGEDRSQGQEQAWLDELRKQREHRAIAGEQEELFR